MSNITAKIIADSESIYTGERITTFELEYPRFIHSEFMTHRMLSKNSASSRAIPITAMHKHIEEVPQYPSKWGKNNPGMQSKEEMSELERTSAIAVWDAARIQAISHSKILASIGAHKQIANRTTEPYMQMKVVVTGTEQAYNNFFWLRNHEDADPTIADLAAKMWTEYTECPEPVLLSSTEWHLPYITTGRRVVGGELRYYVGGNEVTLHVARKVSASCCAQVSYRKNDESIEKAEMIFDKLINSVPVHASPVEHQAMPIDYSTTNCYEPDTWEDGVTHVYRDGTLWSGNFRDWIQFRQLIPNHTKW